MCLYLGIYSSCSNSAKVELQVLTLLRFHWQRFVCYFFSVLLLIPSMNLGQFRVSLGVSGLSINDNHLLVKQKELYSMASVMNFVRKVMKKGWSRV